MRINRLIKNLSMLLLGIAIALGGTVDLTLAQSFTEIYVFGDSLSDVGNVFQATNGSSPPSPPYFSGRYSNGRVWVEHLAAKLGLTPNLDTNFAFGGATSDVLENPIPGLLAQVERYTATASANPDALYVLWIGANDYLGGITNPTEPVNNLVTAVERLRAIGAQNIVVLNLPDLGELPGTRASQRSNLLTELTRTHNANLETALNTLSQQTNFNLIYLDVNAWFNQVVQNPAQFGFTNVTNACLSAREVCDNPNEYLFWDDIHPTAAAHQLLAELMVPLLTPETAAPTPVATLPVPTTSRLPIVLSLVAIGSIGVGFVLKKLR